MSCFVLCFVFPCLVSHVLSFHALMCPLSFSYVLPSGSLCLLSCSLLVCSSVLLPLVITPGFLPPLSPNLLHLHFFPRLSLLLVLHTSSLPCFEKQKSNTQYPCQPRPSPVCFQNQKIQNCRRKSIERNPEPLPRQPTRV